VPGINYNFEFIHRQGGEEIYFSLVIRPDWFWGPPSLLSSGCWEPFPRHKAARAWSLQLTSIQCWG